jgi:hypothetical protein
MDGFSEKFSRLIERDAYSVMAGHSRSKNGVASLAYARPSTSCRRGEGVDARIRGHDAEGVTSP